jgi:hypothetical protein
LLADHGSPVEGLVERGREPGAPMSSKRIRQAFCRAAAIFDQSIASDKGEDMAADTRHEAFRKSPLAAEPREEKCELVNKHRVCPRLKDGERGCLDGRKHIATLRSIGPTELISLARDNLEELLESNPRAVYQVMRAVIRSLHGSLRRMNIQDVEMSNYFNAQHGRWMMAKSRPWVVLKNTSFRCSMTNCRRVLV